MRWAAVLRHAVSRGPHAEALNQRHTVPQEQILALGIQISDALEAAHGQGNRSPGHQAGEHSFCYEARPRQDSRFWVSQAQSRRRTHGSFDDADFDAGRITDQPRVNRRYSRLHVARAGARQGRLDGRSDLFSFGVVLYEMATGMLPFRGETSGVIFEAILNRAPVPAVRMNPDAPPRLEEIIGRALEKDRELRYQHASDLRADLQRLKRDTDSGRTTAVPDLGIDSATQIPSPPSKLSVGAASSSAVANSAQQSVAQVFPAASKRALPMLAGLAITVLLLSAGAIWLVKRSHDTRWARTVAVPEISRLADEEKFSEAFALATKAQKFIPDDPELAKSLAADLLPHLNSDNPAWSGCLSKNLRRYKRSLGIRRADAD